MFTNIRNIAFCVANCCISPWNDLSSVSNLTINHPVFRHAPECWIERWRFKMNTDWKKTPAVIHSVGFQTHSTLLLHSSGGIFFSSTIYSCSTNILFCLNANQTKKKHRRINFTWTKGAYFWRTFTVVWLEILFLVFITGLTREEGRIGRRKEEIERRN